MRKHKLITKKKTKKECYIGISKYSLMCEARVLLEDIEGRTLET